MNEVEFRIWLTKSNKNKKVQSDIVSRIKAIQREMGNCDIDNEYKKDKCKSLLMAFKNKGINDIMNEYGSVRLPIGKYNLSTYSYSLRIYIEFLEDKNK